MLLDPKQKSLPLKHIDTKVFTTYPSHRQEGKFLASSVVLKIFSSILLPPAVAFEASGQDILVS